MVWRPGAALSEHGVEQAASRRSSSVAVAPAGLLPMAIGCGPATGRAGVRGFSGGIGLGLASAGEAGDSTAPVAGWAGAGPDALGVAASFAGAPDSGGAGAIPRDAWIRCAIPPTFWGSVGSACHPINASTAAATRIAARNDQNPDLDFLDRSDVTVVSSPRARR